VAFAAHRLEGVPSALTSMGFVTSKIAPRSVMIYATADMNFYTPAYNLSTAYKHYENHINLCSTIKDTLETLCNLSTA
jgi:hypothetical protein